MMIKKFSEFIEEGMWGSALRRSNTAKERKDDEANRIQEFINKQREPESIYITDGNVINSKGSIVIRNTDLVDGKLPVKFGIVDEYFDCIECTSLTSLEGSPQKVGRDFYCSNCTSLTSLKGAPQKVGRAFICSQCSSLTTLEGSPQEVGRNFYCRNCPSLTSLEGAPKKIGGKIIN